MEVLLIVPKEDFDFFENFFNIFESKFILPDKLYDLDDLWSHHLVLLNWFLVCIILIIALLKRANKLFEFSPLLGSDVSILSPDISMFLKSCDKFFVFLCYPTLHICFLIFEPGFLKLLNGIIGLSVVLKL